VTAAGRLPYPVRNVVRRWRTMVSMMVGVGVALSIGMTILAIISAEMNVLTGDYARSGVGVYVVTRGGKLVAELAGETPGIIQNARATLAEVRAWPEVQHAIGAFTWTMVREPEGPRRRGAPTELVSVIGVDGDPAAMPGLLALEAGRWMRNSNQIVVGRTLARDRSLRLGDSLRLNGGSFTIVGIGKLRGFSSFGQSAVAYMDYRALLQRAQLGDGLNVIAVQTSQPAEVRRRLDEQGGLSAWTPPQLLAQAQQASASSLAIDWMLILMTLGIAGLFVTTMLNHSVAERRAEFALLRAIGFPSTWVTLSVALEAVAITVAAGLLGVAISLGFGFLIDTVLAPQYGLDSLYRVDLPLFVLIFGLAAALGVLSGVLPARRAAGVDPVEVLREV
jgi:ABC-type antimicrobial peptide transport system permease subunit